MPLSRAALEDRLRADAPLILDGATGTELERRGFATRLPLWSAGALDRDPELVQRIHADYVACGVDAVTANTFRTQRRTLAQAGIADRAEELTLRAVALARRAAGDRGSSAQRAQVSRSEPEASEGHQAGERRPAVWVFGSSPTLEDCYHPERVPDANALAREHAEHARHLARAGVDAILVETMNTQREAVAALRAARDAGLPALASFVCWEGARLLSGEPLADAARAAADADACAVLVNCLPPSNAEACLDALAAQPLPFGIYPNLGEPEDELGFRRSEDMPPERFGELAAGWAARGAHVLGGCCGTTPAHLAALVARVR